MTGCISSEGLGPQADPQAAEAMAYGNAIKTAQKDAAWPKQQWWKALGDPQLDNWVGKAVANSPTMAEAQARIRNAMAVAGLTAGSSTPKLNVDASIKRHKWATDNFYGPGELTGANTWDNSLGLGFSYVLDFWGREKNKTEAALNRAQVTVAESQASQLSLESQMVKAYIAFSYDYAERDVKQALLKQQQHILALVKQRLDGGLGTELDVAQAQAPIPAMEQALEDVNERLALSRNAIAVLAGLSPAAGAQLKRPAMNLTQAPSIPSVVPLALVGHRPDVVASRWLVASYARDIDAAKADFYPNINLAASVGLSAVNGNILNFLDKDKFTYTAGPVLSLPILDGDTRRDTLASYSAGYDIAVAKYRQTLLGALKGISDQLIRLHSLDKQQQLAAKAVAVAQQSYDLTLKSYQGGLSTYMDVLNTEQNLFTQKLVVEHLVASRLAAHAALQVALGGGLDDDKDSPQAKQMKPTKVAIRHDH
ncbi:efflux transporter outer membrane subunit [Gallaecimonas mangrovi]|uniref:efflux transporter outer membrane subunit n=1 Tax=Gallaecimonas mangrovi TaxID=2291597 RepID=UPI000E1FF806|nr:efflux transporter outer membrane subunit [Gallaecimonas mangrovi]